MALQATFLEQARSCGQLGSPFMARLMTILAHHMPRDTELARRFAVWPGDVSGSGHSLPLRLAAGLHALVLAKRDADLSRAYPPHDVNDATLERAILAAMRRHDGHLCAWAESPPQTNEVRRSAVLIAAAHELAQRFKLPISLSELGASGGLNLMFDRFGLMIDGKVWGPDGSNVQLSPEWRGARPPGAKLVIAERRGVDRNPLRIGQPEDELRLMSFIWPDQFERMTRTRSAITLFDAHVDEGDAIDWIEQRLKLPKIGKLHLIYHTIVWQYLSPERREKGTTLIEAAGAQATDEAPLAWLSMEGVPSLNQTALTLRLWPGDLRVTLGNAGYHGEWVAWNGL